MTAEILSVGSPALWAGFTLFVLAMLALDLGVFHRHSHRVSFKEALTWSCVWIGLAGLFAVGVQIWFGTEKALEFATGYVIEKALSVDNIFVIVVLFGSFGVPAMYQHRVLFWGILGALVMRALFIVAGAALLDRFHWIIYVFGALLALTGVKLMLQRDQEPHPERNPLFLFCKRLVPSTSQYHGDKFWVREAGRVVATPLFLVLMAVEATDLVFAVDSIPAIFAVTNDPFIVYTSNIFAILGLRSMYFLLADVVTKFRYLKVGLALILLFVGAKMVLMDVYKVPIGASLGVIAAILAGSILASLRPARTAAATDRGSA